MTLETRVLIGLKDLTSLQFQCQCGARVTRNPENGDQIPHTCGQCHVTWRNAGDEESLIITFVRALAALRKGVGAPYTVLLEIDGKELLRQGAS